MLRRLGLQFAGRFQIRHQREMDVQAVFLADIERKLADRFQKRLAFDIADRAADFGDDDVDVVVGQLVNDALDFVRDVRNDLHGFAQEFAAAFLVDHAQINLAGGVVRIARQRAVGESFVVAQIEIGLAAVVEHVDFAVLVRAHRAGIDVDVRIELLHPHAQAAAFQQQADAGAGQPFAQGTNDAAGHENVFGHIQSVRKGRGASCNFYLTFNAVLAAASIRGKLRLQSQTAVRDSARYLRDKRRVIGRSVDADRRFVDDADEDFVAILQNPQLLEIFQLLQRRAGQRGEFQQEIAAIGVQAEVLEKVRRVGVQQLVAPLAGMRNRRRG